VTAPTTTPTSVKAGERTSGSDSALPGSEKSLGELVATATKDLSLLVSQEVALAKAELKKEVAHAGKGAGMLGGAGFTGVFALVFLSIALAYAISWFGIGLGWGFFIVGMLYLVVAAVLGLLGKKQLSKVGPPEKTIATVKDDVAWAKHPTRP
jgi:Putative Actinobacterial Holin-X, holin superfamily III